MFSMRFSKLKITPSEHRVMKLRTRELTDGTKEEVVTLKLTIAKLLRILPIEIISEILNYITPIINEKLYERACDIVYYKAKTDLYNMLCHPKAFQLCEGVEAFIKDMEVGDRYGVTLKVVTDFKTNVYITILHLDYMDGVLSQRNMNYLASFIRRMQQHLKLPGYIQLLMMHYTWIPGYNKLTPPEHLKYYIKLYVNPSFIEI